MTIAGWHLTPQEVITSPLPALKIGPANETTSTSKYRFMFQGHLGKWPDFCADSLQFYMSEKTKAAFKRCENIPTDIDPSISEDNPDYAALEHIQPGGETDLDGRFKCNVVSRVRSVLRTLWNPKYNNGREPDDMPQLPKTFEAGMAKINPIDLRPEGHEPDVVFKVPVLGDEQVVRIIGELKFCGTCSIEDMLKDPELRSSKSFRNLLGQVARDMRKFHARYGFVSTYNETMFLKISERDNHPGDYALYYSPIIKSTDQVCFDNNGDPVSSNVVSTKLGILNLLHKVADSDESSWKINLDNMEQDDWFTTYISGDPVTEVSPHTDYRTRTQNRPGPLTRPSTRTLSYDSDQRQHLALMDKFSKLSILDMKNALVSVSQTSTAMSDDSEDEEYGDTGIPIKEPSKQRTHGMRTRFGSHGISASGVLRPQIVEGPINEVEGDEEIKSNTNDG